MTEQEAKDLLQKYEDGLCNVQEKTLVESWYINLSSQAEVLGTEPDYLFWNRKIKNSLPVQKAPEVWKLWPRIAAAAVIIIAGTAAFFYYHTNHLSTGGTSAGLNYVSDIKPGGNSAYLTLADGKKLSLNGAKNGKLAKEADVEITKTADGQLTYTAKENSGPMDSRINTIETPRAGQYQIRLPDGTKVWLNSATTLRYPTKFTGAERRVELKGEGYFEVAHDKLKPFKVISNHQIIEVLGTHFNINSYKDEESIKTTLVEGMVRVAVQNGLSTVLKPGEQSVVLENEIKVARVNTGNVIAWTNNIFVFAKEDLGSIMRKISRWYDIEVVCPPEMSKRIFSGTVSRQKSLLEMLEVMSLTQTFHFKLEGRRITIMP